MKGRRIPYSAEELAWLRANHTMVIGDYHRAFVKRFGRPDVSAGHVHALRKRKGWLTGRSGRFEKGLVPANKGKPCAPGTGGLHPNSRRTQFRKGELRGAAKEKLRPVGAERVSKDGYLERKVHDGLPRQSRWRGVHLILWEALNGPVPKGHALKCLDGDRRNTDPANWIAVPRALLPRLGGRYGRDYDAAPAELKPTIMAVAKLEQAVSERRKAAANG